MPCGSMLLHMGYIKKKFSGGRFLPKITTFDGLKAFQTRRVCNLFLLLSRHVGRLMLVVRAMRVERCSRLASAVAFVLRPTG